MSESDRVHRPDALATNPCRVPGCRSCPGRGHPDEPPPPAILGQGTCPCLRVFQGTGCLLDLATLGVFSSPVPRGGPAHRGAGQGRPGPGKPPGRDGSRAGSGRAGAARSRCRALNAALSRRVKPSGASRPREPSPRGHPSLPPPSVSAEGFSRSAGERAGGRDAAPAGKPGLWFLPVLLSF